jgi:hypothetical protein
MAFDASTQIRQKFWFNQLMPIFMGMKAKELHDRLAYHDLAVPFCDLDGVSIFLHHLLHDLLEPSVPRTKFIRLSAGSGASKRFMLVCWSTFSILDSQGRVLEVGPSQTPMSKTARIAVQCPDGRAQPPSHLNP